MKTNKIMFLAALVLLITLTVPCARASGDPPAGPAMSAPVYLIQNQIATPLQLSAEFIGSPVSKTGIYILFGRYDRQCHVRDFTQRHRRPDGKLYDYTHFLANVTPGTWKYLYPGSVFS